MSTTSCATAVDVSPRVIEEQRVWHSALFLHRNDQFLTSNHVYFPRIMSNNVSSTRHDRYSSPSAASSSSSNSNQHPASSPPPPPLLASPFQSIRDYSASPELLFTSHNRRGSSGSYPSWLPARPQVPVPTSTFSISGGRKANPRSVRIVGHHDRANATSDTRVPSEVVQQNQNQNQQQQLPAGQMDERMNAWRFASGATRPSYDSIPRPRYRELALHLDLLQSPSRWVYLQFIIMPLVVFGHVFLQTFFDFNAVFILLQMAKVPVTGVDGSARNWALASAAYIGCWATWIFCVVLLYEVIYTFVRQWRTKRPLMTPLYFSFAAQNLISVTSYTNFCFIRYIRRSAFKASAWDGLAETFWFYSQNLPTVALLLPRAALCLALLFAVSTPDVNYAGGRDGTFFDASGALTAYAKGVLIANAAWTVWKSLVLLGSWFGLWLVSGQVFAGLCGPRFRTEEEQNTYMSTTFASASLSSLNSGYPIPWPWKERTRVRILEAHDFCLSVKRQQRASYQSNTLGGEPATLPKAAHGEPFFAPSDVEKVMAAAASEPRRGALLSEEFFESPKTSDDEKRASFPFQGYASNGGHDNETTSPESAASPPLRQQPDEDEDIEKDLEFEDAELQLDASTEDDITQVRRTSSSMDAATQPRQSDSMSSLGTPLPAQDFPPIVRRSTIERYTPPPIPTTPPRSSTLESGSPTSMSSHYVPLFRERLLPTATRHSPPPRNVSPPSTSTGSSRSRRSIESLPPGSIAGPSRLAVPSRSSATPVTFPSSSTSSNTVMRQQSETTHTVDEELQKEDEVGLLSTQRSSRSSLGSSHRRRRASSGSGSRSRTRARAQSLIASMSRSSVDLIASSIRTRSSSNAGMTRLRGDSDYDLTHDVSAPYGGNIPSRLLHSPAERAQPVVVQTATIGEEEHASVHLEDQSTTNSPS